ncbi:hypothetical protein ZWY2020_034097 [Hordeum vulgare]|nr:hypothetical protein ZWY2020_034097 [Hordeum vulgare]
MTSSRLAWAGDRRLLAAPSPPRCTGRHLLADPRRLLAATSPPRRLFAAPSSKLGKKRVFSCDSPPRPAPLRRRLAAKPPAEGTLSPQDAILPRLPIGYLTPRLGVEDA